MLRMRVPSTNRGIAIVCESPLSRRGQTRSQSPGTPTGLGISSAARSNDNHQFKGRRKSLRGIKNLKRSTARVESLATRERQMHTEQT